MGALNDKTSLVLVNAIYFKGMWAEAFDRGFTREEVFRLAGGGTVRVPLMLGMRKALPYVETKGFQAIDLVYEGGDLSMLVLLPSGRNELPALEERLSATMMRDCVSRMDAQPVTVLLPRFKLGSGSIDLRTPLATLGMPLAFAPLEADFSGMNGREPPSEESLFIFAVLHQAHVEVMEEGTEALAATAVLMPPGGRPPVDAGHGQFRCSGRTTRSCSPYVSGRATQSCFSDESPIRRGVAEEAREGRGSA